MKIIINRLPGKATETFTGDNGNGIGVEMPAFIDRRQRREAGRGNSHPHRPQFFLERFHVRLHGIIMALNLEFVKKKIVSGKGVREKRLAREILAKSDGAAQVKAPL